MNSFGQTFRVSIFGESHGPEIGVLMDGVPAGIPLCPEDFAADIERRRPGAEGTTARREEDTPVIVSGVFEGQTTGAPLCITFRNSDTRSSDYEAFRSTPRPGHADYAASQKWGGANDLRGGGHFSGRLTLPFVAAGVVAKKILALAVPARIISVQSGVSFEQKWETPVEKPATSVENQASLSIQANIVAVGGEADSSRWLEMLADAREEGDSLGGVVECRVSGVPAGVGEPFFDSIESRLSHILFAIPGVRGVEFGDGFAASAMKGSEHNDPFGPDGPLKNGSGGINGGITNGADIVFRVAFKPTSSIAKPQQTWNFEKNCTEVLTVKGRHDVCFALRTPVVVEAAAAIVLADFIVFDDILR